MTTKDSLWTTIPPHVRSRAKQFAYFGLGTGLTIFYAQIVHAQSSSDRSLVQNPYSLETILAALAGAVITILFLRGMYLVLTYASETYDLEDDEDVEGASHRQENDPLLYGTFGWIIGSALVIASYGWGWRFLYIGPILCLLGPVVPIVAMNLDIKKYKRVLADRAASRRSRSSY